LDVPAVSLYEPEKKMEAHEWDYSKYCTFYIKYK
jgi:hypothetical protein